MWLSLITGAITTLNASAFLLMAAGSHLLEYIVISSIFSVAASIYTWMLPAAVGYREDSLPLVRLLQYGTGIAASFVILLSHLTTMGFVFVALMLIDIIIFPAYMLLFRSKTGNFIRFDFVRGIANSIALIVVLFFMDRDPQSYAIFLLINFTFAGVVMAIVGFHRPPSLRTSGLRSLRLMKGKAFWSLQLRLQLATRAIETGSLITLGHLKILPAIICLKIGLSISSALAVNARAHRLPVLVVTHIAAYAACIMTILLVCRIDVAVIPEALRLIDLTNALMMLPIALASYVLSIMGLRISQVKIAPELVT